MMFWVRLILCTPILVLMFFAMCICTIGPNEIFDKAEDSFTDLVNWVVGK